MDLKIYDSEGNSFKGRRFSQLQILDLLSMWNT